MKISMEKNLPSIREKLINKGYEVYDFKDKVISDIYIYYEDKVGNNIYNGMYGNSQGSFIINAFGKTNDEIIYCVEKRLYSPLF